MIQAVPFSFLGLPLAAVHKKKIRTQPEEIPLVLPSSQYLRTQAQTPESPLHVSGKLWAVPSVPCVTKAVDVGITAYGGETTLTYSIWNVLKHCYA